MDKDEVIPREWLAKMDKWQHELESSIHWDQGDVLIVDVSLVDISHTLPTDLVGRTTRPSMLAGLGRVTVRSRPASGISLA